MIIYESLWKLMRIYDNLWDMIFYDNLWKFMKIYDNLWKLMKYEILWKFLIIFESLWEFMHMKIYEILYIYSILIDNQTSILTPTSNSNEN